jgi:hypothetical protein
MVPVDGVFQRNSLRVRHINGLSFRQPFVEGVGDFGGTFFGAGAAGDALVDIDVTGRFSNGNGEIALFTGNGGDFGEGEQFNVEMPADLDQFRGNDSHGAVVCGEGLVELRHRPTDGRRFFDKIDEVTGVCQIEGGLHAGDAAAHHENRTNCVVHLYYPCVVVDCKAGSKSKFFRIARRSAFGAKPTLMAGVAW